MVAQSATQNGIDQRARSLRGECDRLEDGRVGRRLQQEELIKSEAEKIARPRIKFGRAKFSDPEIKQRQVAENAVEKLERETTVRFLEGSWAQQLIDHLICKSLPGPPADERAKGKLASRGHGEALRLPSLGRLRLRSADRSVLEAELAHCLRVIKV